MGKPTSSETLGCGSSQSLEITLNIQTTTGGNFSITVENNYTVDQLKKIISKKLKVPKDRICLLHRERQLRDGLLKDNGLMDGSRVILLPSVETGLLTQRPESSVMQALESLNDSQVNDFLSGKSPLNLTMRLGDHMMLIQLQLSTLNPISSTLAGISAARAAAQGSKRPFVTPQRTSTKSTPSTSTEDDSKLQPKSPKEPTECDKSEVPVTVAKEEDITSDMNETPDENGSPSTSASDSKSDSPTVKSADDIKSFLRKQDIETLQNAFEIFKSLAEMQEDMEKDSDESTVNDTNDQSVGNCSSKYPFGSENTVMDSSSSGTDSSFEEQSPIKSLSNLVSSPLKSSLQSNYSPVSVPIINKEECGEIEDKPPPSTSMPSKYVPLPSSLKNNLIESLVEVNPNQTKAPPTSPVITDPIAANLTSCLCSKLNPDYNCSTNCHSMGHVITKVDNPHVMMETDVQDESAPVSVDNISDIYPETEVDNIIAEECLEQSSLSNFDSLSPTEEPTFLEKNSEDVAHSSSPSQSHDVSESTKNKRLHYLLHKTSKHNNPIMQNKQKAFMQSIVNKHLKKKMQQTTSNANSNDLSQPSTSKQSEFSHSGYLSNHFENLSEPSTSHCSKETSVFRVPNIPTPKKVEKPPLLSASVSDAKALIEASKNLTQTLKKLSKEVLTSKVDLTNEENTRAKIGQGAVIESMKHHGKGIYSGTFSGTLNPALQDRFGRPKRDISTIIHILNDLLCATPPQYRRGARITFEPTHNTCGSSARTKQREGRRTESSTAGCSAERPGSPDCLCSKCSSPGKCPYGECNGHYPTPSPARSTPCPCKAPPGQESGQPCTCSTGRTTAVPAVSPTKKCHVCLDKEKDDKLKRTSNKNCKKCHSVSALALENSKTKCKLDHLRLVMQQKKQRREMRKLKAAPYVTTSPGPAITPLQAEAASVIAEEIETLA